ncbi:MAG: pro-sigmaK processing inhibitor BofA family protein [Candidatus Micrarchaeaceae archaeon]
MLLSLIPVSSGLVSELIIILGIALVLLIVFKLGKLILKLIFGIITNTILGLIAILLLDRIFGLGIPLKLPELAASAIFGLPAVGAMVILRLLGAAIV